MTNEELITRLRDLCGPVDYNPLVAEAADRIEALARDLANTQADFTEQLGKATAYELRMIDAEAKAATLMKELEDWKRRCINAEAAILSLMDERDEAMREATDAAWQCGKEKDRVARLEAALWEIKTLNSPEKAWEAYQAKHIAVLALKGKTP